MNITKDLLFAIGLVMLFTSCEKEEMVAVDYITTANEIGYTSIYLEDATAIITKAVQPEEELEEDPVDERKIHTLSFFIFNSDEERDLQHGYQSFTYTGSQYTFAVTAGTDKTILGAANVAYLGDLGTASLEEVREILQDVVLERALNASVHGAAMAGEVSGIHVRKGKIEIIRIGVSRAYDKYSFLAHH